MQVSSLARVAYGRVTKALYRLLFTDVFFLIIFAVPNRGAEAMAYLSSIIKHYDALPDFMLFMHSHRRAWHTPLPQDWNLRRLVTHPPKDLPSENGYMPLACYERWGSDICKTWMHMYLFWNLVCFSFHHFMWVPLLSSCSTCQVL